MSSIIERSKIEYWTAERAFNSLFKDINKNGLERPNGTKVFYNVGFYILEPQSNLIDIEWRKWSQKYAEREWKWYLSGNRSVEEIKKFAPIWDTMHSGDNIVNSNYGWQWERNDQLALTIDQLKKDPNTRQAWISIFDGKEKAEYSFDTPCTLSIGFEIINSKLCMSVLMRSNDLWYGFCNDQYCFSEIQKIVAEELGIETGWYYHYAMNLHIYENQYNAHLNFYK